MLVNMKETCNNLLNVHIFSYALESDFIRQIYGNHLYSNFIIRCTTFRTFYLFCNI